MDPAGSGSFGWIGSNGDSGIRDSEVIGDPFAIEECCIRLFTVNFRSP
jgi:hypothetical protein